MTANREAMLRGWRQVRRRLRETCPGVRHANDRWMDARQYYHAALAARMAGRRPAAAGRLLQAMWKDPLWTVGQLQLALARRRGGTLPAAEAPLFLDADPAMPIADDPWAASKPAAWLRRLDDRRLARLGKLDEA
jgi:hypothetical protein